jgi:uncharacterized protein YaaN involved in tellurite resistance
MDRKDADADADKECVRSLTREKCAVTEFKEIMMSDVLPILEKSMVREKFLFVVSKFDNLENELHMRKQEENLEEGIDRLEKVMEEAEATYRKIERTKEDMERRAQSVEEMSDNMRKMHENLEEEIRKLEKVREEAEASLLKEEMAREGGGDEDDEEVRGK